MPSICNALILDCPGKRPSALLERSLARSLAEIQIQIQTQTQEKSIARTVNVPAFSGAARFVSRRIFISFDFILG